MWSNSCPAKLDNYGAKDVSYHVAVMLTTDLHFNVNSLYSATDVFNALNQRYRISTRYSLYPQLSLNSIKRALSTKWVRTAIHSLYCDTEFGLSCRAEDIIVGEFGRGQYIKFAKAIFIRNRGRKSARNRKDYKYFITKVSQQQHYFAFTGFTILQCRKSSLTSLVDC